MIASHNKDKIKEITAVLRDFDINILSMDDFPDIEPVNEDRDTICGNAMKKALEVAQRSGILTLADDTGLFIHALNGEPGVFAARYAGEHCSYEDNQNKVLRLMEFQDAREAEFRTAIALSLPDGIVAVHEGSVKGTITRIKRGNGGFGYDPIFEVSSHGKTYAEMNDEEKNSCSHRALALQSIKPVLVEFLNLKIEV